MPVHVIVLLSIALLLVLLLFSRVRVYAHYDGDIRVSVRYLFLKFRMNKPKKGQANKEKNAKEEKPKKRPVSIAQFRDFLSLFERFFEDIKKTADRVRRKARIDRLNLNLTVGTGDAAKTAITYGEACAVIYPAVAAASDFIRIKKKKIVLSADFSGGTTIVFACVASISVGDMLSVGIVTVIKLLVALIKNPINFRQRGVVK